MSHYIDQQVSITDVDLLKKTLRDLGIPFRENVRAVGYQGRQTQICDVVIPQRWLRENGYRVYGDFGYYVKADKTMGIQIDSYDSRAIQEGVLFKINQAYSENLLRKIAKENHYRIVREQQADGSIKVTLVPTMLTQIKERAKERRFDRQQAKAKGQTLRQRLSIRRR